MSFSPWSMLCTAVIMALLDTKSKAPTPSMESTVQFGSRSVITSTTCAMLSHPARVESAYWKGFVMYCFARVFATNLLMTSPTTNPRIHPFAFCNAVIWPNSQSGDNFFGKFRLCESLGNFEELGAILSIVEKWAQLLVAHARRASSCSPTSGSQIVEETHPYPIPEDWKELSL